MFHFSRSLVTHFSSKVLVPYRMPAGTMLAALASLLNARRGRSYLATYSTAAAVLLLLRIFGPDAVGRTVEYHKHTRLDLAHFGRHARHSLPSFSPSRPVIADEEIMCWGTLPKFFAFFAFWDVLFFVRFFVTSDERGQPIGSCSINSSSSRINRNTATP